MWSKFPCLNNLLGLYSNQILGPNLHKKNVVEKKQRRQRAHKLAIFDGMDNWKVRSRAHLNYEMDDVTRFDLSVRLSVHTYDEEIFAHF